MIKVKLTFGSNPTAGTVFAKQNKMIKKLLFLTLMTTSHISLCAQEIQTDLEKYTPKRFIDKVEVIAGPSLAFNNGNKFVENYKDDNVQNKRLLKIGYTFGIGLYHPVSNRIEINTRLQYEKKGTKTELNTPLTTNTREINFKDYTYNYLTLLLAARISLGQKGKCFFSLGAYYSKIKGIKGYGWTYNTLDHQKSEGHYKGRFFEDIRSDGTIYSFTWIPGLQSFESFDLGAVLSVGYSIPIKEKQRLTIQLVDNLGLKNINKDNPYGLEEKNHTVSLILGYILKRPTKK